MVDIRSVDNVQEWVLSSYRVGPGDPTQMARFGSEHSDLLSPLAG